MGAGPWAGAPAPLGHGRGRRAGGGCRGGRRAACCPGASRPTARRTRASTDMVVTTILDWEALAVNRVPAPSPRRRTPEREPGQARGPGDGGPGRRGRRVRARRRRRLAAPRRRRAWCRSGSTGCSRPPVVRATEPGRRRDPARDPAAGRPGRRGPDDRRRGAVRRAGNAVVRDRGSTTSHVLVADGRAPTGKVVDLDRRLGRALAVRPVHARAARRVGADLGRPGSPARGATAAS